MVQKKNVVTNVPFTAKPKTGIWFSSILLGTALISGCASNSSSTQASIESAPAPDKKEVVFVGHHDGDLDIYLTSLDTGELKKLTQNDRDDMHPAWSPDGKKIAFSSTQTGLNEIFVMNSDGSDLLRLTDNQAMDITPVWSPDGDTVVYVSDRGGLEQIYSYHIPSKTESVLTDSEAGSIQPLFSKKGDKIAFLERKGKKLLLTTMNPDGSDKKTLVTDRSVITMDWSPDDSQIVYAGRSKRVNDLFSVDVETTEIERLTNDIGSDTNPLWLPDGENILYLRAENFRDRMQIHKLNVADKKVERLSFSELEESNMSISPDGKEISFIRFEGRFYQTYVMNLENREAQKLAGDLDRAKLTPSFKPAG